MGVAEGQRGGALCETLWLLLIVDGWNLAEGDCKGMCVCVSVFYIRRDKYGEYVVRGLERMGERLRA